MERARSLAAAAAVVVLAVWGLRGLGGLVGLELAVYDAWLRMERPERAPSRVVLLEITEQDILDQGHWPISDRTLAATLERLVEAGARVIGLDLYRNLPVAPGVEVFARLLREEPRIIAASKFGGEGEGIPGPPALVDDDRVGFNDLPPDTDDTIRRGLLFQDDGVAAPEMSFALRLASAALAADGVGLEADPVNPEWLRLGGTSIPYFEADDGGYVNADAAGYQFLLDFGAREVGFDTFSMGSLLAGAVSAERIRDHIVVVGSNARSLPDHFSVPTGPPIAGMRLHGEAVDQLVRMGLGEAAPLRVLAEWQELALIAIVALLGCTLGLGMGSRPVLGVAAEIAVGVAGLAAIWGAGVVAYRVGWWLPVAGPAVAWVGAAGVATAWFSSRERAQREELMRIFAVHVSPGVAEEIWNHRAEVFSEGRVRPRRLVASVAFVDMRGYTNEAEKMDPERLMAWSNAFMDRMAQILYAHGAMIDDYFGDGIKANFGVPIARLNDAEIAADARNAVRCALAISVALGELNAAYQRDGLPECQAKIGIHTGAVVAGSTGSRERLKYTTVGDVVVTAQRLESTTAVAHDYAAEPCRILISKATQQRLDADFETDALGEVTLKGRGEPVAVYRVRSAQAE